jgi:asparagine synthase (glutamine-hydrolysing)
MCGICGIVAAGGTSGRSGRDGDVRSMVAALRHRGPDSVGFADDARADFGIARLAIRGLASELQPMRDDASGVIILCNGEIDNHRALRAWLAERGHEAPAESDVGVLPGLYLELGPAFVERLAGPFAIAVWDPRDGTLLLARDRAGER